MAQLRVLKASSAARIFDSCRRFRRHEFRAGLHTGRKDRTLTVATARERTAPRRRVMTKPVESPDAVILKTVLTSLGDAKAEDIVSINMKDKSPLFDCLVVASGRSHRHVGAIAERL